MPENFQDLLKDLKQNDKEAWDKLIITTGIVIRHWAEEERFEILWCADEKGILNKNEFVDRVISKLKVVLKVGPEISDFSNLKQQILHISLGILEEGFGRYVDLIIAKDKKAWNILSDVLKLKIYRFLSMEGYSQINHFEEIFQETLIVFTEKMALGKLKFINSCKLKSFMLRIAQLKLYEKFRVSKKQKDSLSIDEMNYNLPEPGSYLEVFEDREYASYLFKKLERTEQIVLYYYFFEQKQLKEIAKQLNVSQENCRIIKYRAIRKLRNIVGQNKETKLVN